MLDTSRKEISHRRPHFLPDGRHFVYTALVASTHSEDNALYVESLDSGKVSGSKDRKRLLSTDHKGAYAPPANGGTGHLLFWRDNFLMAQSFDPQKLELAGEPVPIADQRGAPDNRGTAVLHFSISDNGVLAYPSNSSALGNLQMVWYDRSGKRLGTVGEPGGYGLPRLSPDQKQLAVNIGGIDPQNSAVWLLHLTRNTTSRFTFHLGLSARPIWSPDGSRIVFTSGRDGGFNLYQKAASGVGIEELILKTGSDVRASDWSRDGHFIVYDQLEWNGSSTKTKQAIWGAAARRRPEAIPVRAGRVC